MLYNSIGIPLPKKKTRNRRFCRWQKWIAPIFRPYDPQLCFYPLTCLIYFILKSRRLGEPDLPREAKNWPGIWSLWRTRAHWYWSTDHQWTHSSRRNWTWRTRLPYPSPLLPLFLPEKLFLTFYFYLFQDSLNDEKAHLLIPSVVGFVPRIGFQEQIKSYPRSDFGARSKFGN